MWKLVLAFIIFAALAIYLLSKGGDIDMSGEKHGADQHHIVVDQDRSIAAVFTINQRLYV